MYTLKCSSRDLGPRGTHFSQSILAWSMILPWQPAALKLGMGEARRRVRTPRRRSSELLMARQAQQSQPPRPPAPLAPESSAGGEKSTVAYKARRCVRKFGPMSLIIMLPALSPSSTSSSASTSMCITSSTTSPCGTER